MLSQSLMEQGSPTIKEQTKNSDLLPQKVMQQTGQFGRKDSANFFGSDSEYRSIEQHEMSLRESRDFAIANKTQKQRFPRKNAQFNESANSRIKMKVDSAQQYITDDQINKNPNIISNRSRSPRNDSSVPGKFSNTNSPSIKKRVISKYYDGGKKKKLIEQPQINPKINSIQFTGNSSPHPPTPGPEHNNMTPTAAQDGRNLAKLDLSAALISGGASIGNMRQIPAVGITSLYRSQFSDGTSHISSILDPQTNLGVNYEQITSIQTLGSPNRNNIPVSSTPMSKKQKISQPQNPSISEKKLPIPTQSSPQASPALNQTVLPDSKFQSFCLQQPNNNNMIDSNMLGLRLIQNLSNEQEEEQEAIQKKLWRPQELISPNFSYTKDIKQNNGLPTATFDSINNKSLSSGKNPGSQKQGNQMKVKMMRFNEEQKDFQQLATCNTQQVELIKKGKSRINMIAKNKKTTKSNHSQKRIPLSLSNFQFQPMEKLDYQEIEQLIEEQQPTFAQFPHTTHHSKMSSFTFNYMNYNNQNPSSKAQSRGQNAAMKRNSQIPPKIKRPFIGSKNLAAPVAPQDLSPYSSKHGRITKRSAGAWCQFPQSMLSEEDRMRLNTAARNTNGKVIWGFYSAGDEDWSNVLKNMEQMSRPASAALRPQSQLKANQMPSDRLSIKDMCQTTKLNSKRGTRPMTTPQQRQKTIAIKMKTVSYQNSDSATTSKQFNIIHSNNIARKSNDQIGKMRGSLSQDLLKSRAHCNSFTDANLISQKTLHPYNFEPKLEPKGLIFKGQQLSRSSTPSLTRLKNSGPIIPGIVKRINKNMKFRARSTTFISHIYPQPVVVEEEPLKQADITSRHHYRLGSIA